MLLDFALAVFIFLIALGTLSVFWLNRLDEKLQSQHFDEMNLKANLAAETLVKSAGDPTNWENLDPELVNLIGVVSQDRSVSEQKLNAFRNLNYDTARQLLNISEYDFYFELEGIDNVTTGLAPVADVDRAAVTRIVEYKGSEATARITLYRT